MSKLIFFSLSEQSKVREYLDATALDIFTNLHAKVEEAKAEHAAVLKQKADADAKYRETKTRRDAELQRLSDEHAAAREADEKYWIPTMVMRGGKGRPIAPTEPGCKEYDPKNAASHARVEETQKALEKYRMQSWPSTQDQRWQVLLAIQTDYGLEHRTGHLPTRPGVYLGDDQLDGLSHVLLGWVLRGVIGLRSLVPFAILGAAVPDFPHPTVGPLHTADATLLIT